MTIEGINPNQGNESMPIDTKNLTPEQKAELLKQLQADQEQTAKEAKGVEEENNLIDLIVDKSASDVEFAGDVAGVIGGFIADKVTETGENLLEAGKIVGNRVISDVQFAGNIAGAVGGFMADKTIAAGEDVLEAGEILKDKIQGDVMMVGGAIGAVGGFVVDKAVDKVVGDIEVINDTLGVISDEVGKQIDEYNKSSGNTPDNPGPRSTLQQMRGF